MTLELFKDLMVIIKQTSDTISNEQKHYEVIFEDFQGLNRGLCNLLDGLVDTLDKHCGGYQWISWYVFDNDFGTAGLTAGCIGEEQVIDSVEKLYELIMGEC